MRRFRTCGALLAMGLLAAAYLEAVRAIAGQAFSLRATLARWLFASCVVVIALWVGSVRVVGRAWVFSLRHIILSVAMILAAVVYGLTVHTAAAWAASTVLCAGIVALSGVCHEKSWWVRLPCWSVLAAIGGGLLAVVGQIESRFVEEEFFVALQAIALGVLVMLLLAGRARLAQPEMRLLRESTRGGRARWRVSAPGWAVILGGLLLVS